jgi:hypothetical protein
VPNSKQSNQISLTPHSSTNTAQSNQISATPSTSTYTNAAPQQVQINSQIVFGLAQNNNTVLQNYIEPNTTTALFPGMLLVVVPANSTNNAYNLATLFPLANTPIMWGIMDVSNPGQQINVGLAASGQRFMLNPNGYLTARVNGGAPTLYIDNPSASVNALIQLFMLSN